MKLATTTVHIFLLYKFYALIDYIRCVSVEDKIDLIIDKMNILHYDERVAATQVSSQYCIILSNAQHYIPTRKNDPNSNFVLVNMTGNGLSCKE